MEEEDEKVSQYCLLCFDILLIIFVQTMKTKGVFSI